MLSTAIIDEINSKKISFQSELISWGKSNYRDFPWRKDRTAYSILIAEVLLKRTTAPAVNKFYLEFIASYPSLEILAKADGILLEKSLSRLGYHKVRTKILLLMAQYLTDNYQSQIPSTKQELLKIPHVGNYTANAILTFAYGTPVALLDTNVERILRRVFLSCAPKTTTLKPFQAMADQLMPLEENQSYNYALLDLGGTVCASSKPKCDMCPLRQICDYSSANVKS